MRPRLEPKLEPKIEPKVEAPKVEAEGRSRQAGSAAPPGNVMIMSPGERAWSGGAAKAEAEPAARKRRVPAMAAVIAIAAVAGALGGALVTAGLGHGYATPSRRDAQCRASKPRSPASMPISSR